MEGRGGSGVASHLVVDKINGRAEQKREQEKASKGKGAKEREQRKGRERGQRERREEGRGKRGAGSCEKLRIHTSHSLIRSLSVTRFLLLPTHL